MPEDEEGWEEEREMWLGAAALPWECLSAEVATAEDEGVYAPVYHEAVDGVPGGCGCEAAEDEAEEEEGIDGMLPRCTPGPTPPRRVGSTGVCDETIPSEPSGESEPPHVR